MIHIVFNEADVATLEAAIALDEELQGEIVLIRDDYAVGPLQNLYEEEGKQQRKDWWGSVLADGDYAHLLESDVMSDHETLAEVTTKLNNNEEEQVWIWAAQNKHDVCGYYFILPFMKPFQGRVQILYLNNLPFINEKGGIFYPEWLSEIPPKEFLKAKKLARPITPSEFEVDPDEWQKISLDSRGVRLLEGGKKLTPADYEFYDAELRRFVSPEWQKASRVINQFLSKAKHTTGDAYLLWRLKTMIEDGKIDMQGKPGNMKDFEVKTKSATA